MSGSIGKFAVVFVEYGDACDGFPGILGVYNNLADAAQDMLADIYDYKDNVSGACTTKYTTTTGEVWLNGEVWLDGGKTHGCKWKVIEI